MSDADLAVRRARLSPERRALLERRLRGGAGAASARPDVSDRGPGGGPAPPAPWPAEPPAFFAEPAFGDRLVRVAARAAARAAADPELTAEAADEPRVDRLAAALVAGALRRLGVFGTAGERHTAAGLVERCGVAERHPKVVRRWLEMLADEGWLVRAGEAYESPRPLPAAAHEALRRDDERHLDGGTLAAILTGERHALEYYLAGGSSEEIEAAYREAPMFRYCNRVAEAVLAEAAAALPAGRPLRVLEVGAGTGGTTASLLPLLPADRTRYAYTDVSPFFLDLGRRKFERFDFVHYALLDLERDPGAQGFAAGGFDVVIAAHVLHATRRIAETLAHVHALLAPGGLLVLLEEVRFRRLFNFSMGFLPGFDRFEDAELRRLHPLLDAAGWRRQLETSGFEGVVASTEAGSPAAVLGVDVLVARAGEPPRAPLSLAQERIWAFERRHPGTSCYNVAAPIRLAGALDPARLATALGALADRHDALRTTFEDGAEGPRQRRRPAGAAPALPRVDLGALPAGARETRSGRVISAFAAPPFDLVRGPLWRAVLIRAAAEDHLLVPVCHHLVTDGWSCARIGADLAALYAGRPLPPAPSYARLASAEQRRLASGELEGDLEWWRRRARSLRLDLPRREPPPEAGFARGAVALELAPPTADRLRELARAERATLFAVLLAGLQATLAPWARGGEVAVAVPFGQRDAPELAAAVGLFVSLLPVRVRVGGDPSFRALLAAVRDELAGAFAHPRVPCARLARELDLAPLDLAGGVMFNVPGGAGAPAGAGDGGAGGAEPPAAGGLRFEPRGSFELGCEADLAVYAAEQVRGLRFRLVHRRAALERRWVEELAGRFAALVTAAAADPDRRLSQLAAGAAVPAAAGAEDER